MDEIRRRLSEGESIFDITWGAGWQVKYPSLALLSKYAGIWSGCSHNSEFDFGASVRCGSWFHSTDYEILKFKASGTQDDALKSFDQRIAAWIEANGEDKLKDLKRGWMHGEEWRLLYPSIAKWAEHGKRYCFSLKFKLGGESEVKAWFYDKAANRETVLLEQTIDDSGKSLEILNQCIKNWLEDNVELLAEFKRVEIE